MKVKLMTLLIGAAVLLPLTAMAFECPRIAKQAQARIDEVSGMTKGKMGTDRVEALLSEARTMVSEGMSSHSGAKGKGDHAVAVAKINAAKVYADAAEALLKRL